jgi:hypothetical protein
LAVWSAFSENPASLVPVLIGAARAKSLPKAPKADSTAPASKTVAEMATINEDVSSYFTNKFY